MSTLTNAEIGVHTTVSAYSLSGMQALGDWVDEISKGLRWTMWNLGFVSEPACLSLFVFPMHLRQEIAARLSPKSAPLQKFRELLLQENHEPYFASGDGLRDFRTFTQDLDRVRGESLAAAAPELHGWLART
jgi:hypothetical protein